MIDKIIKSSQEIITEILRLPFQVLVIMIPCLLLLFIGWRILRVLGKIAWALEILAEEQKNKSRAKELSKA